jgi:hypothetical protein
MSSQQSSQHTSQSHQQQMGGRLPRWLLILFIIAFVLAVLSFIGAIIFWIGLVRDKLPDTFGAIFTGSGTIFSFVALVIGVPPFIQYLKERRAANSTIGGNPFQSNKLPLSQDMSGSQAIRSADNYVGPGSNQQKNSPTGQASPQHGTVPIDPDKLRFILSECNETTFSGVVSRMRRQGLKKGILPASSAAQGQRANDLVDWADSDAGPGIDVLYDAYLIESGIKLEKKTI